MIIRNSYKSMYTYTRRLTSLPYLRPVEYAQFKNEKCIRIVVNRLFYFLFDMSNDDFHRSWLDIHKHLSCNRHESVEINRHSFSVE